MTLLDDVDLAADIFDNGLQVTNRDAVLVLTALFGGLSVRLELQDLGLFCL